MEAERFMELYDIFWFEKQIFKKHENPESFNGSESNPDDRFQEKPILAPEFSRIPTMISRSMSDQLGSKLSFDSGYSVSPDSVLVSPKLQTIFSGKGIAEEENSNSNSITTPPTTIAHVQEPHKKRVTRRRKGKRALSKSLSELEFEEVKGFMDLGFVFSEVDKDSSLVSIIPGLQRLGKRDEEESHVVTDKEAVSRPYLSEAWEDLDREKKENPLTNWRISSLSNEVDIKDNLRWWAHTVASAVR